MSVILSVSETTRKMMELVDEFNRKNGSDVAVEINWQYWISNAVYVEKNYDEYTIVTRDGLLLKILDRGEKIVVKLDSLHSSSCECLCGE
ncbi:MAG: hypothetical protein QXX12_03090 [Nanopusillaceae archaeon]